MTIVVGIPGKGIMGSEGPDPTMSWVLMAADSEQRGSLIKSSVRKIARIEGPEWKALIGGAGHGTFIDQAIQQIKLSVDPKPTLAKLRSEIENIVADIHVDRVREYKIHDGDFDLLCALWTRAEGVQLVSVGLGYCLIKDEPVAIGAGDELANYLLATYYDPSQPLYHCGRLATYMIYQVKKHAMYCGGATQVACLLNNGSFDLLLPDTIAEHERSNAAVMEVGMKGLLYLADPRGWGSDLGAVELAIDHIGRQVKQGIRKAYPDLALAVPAQATPITGAGSSVGGFASFEGIGAVTPPPDGGQTPAGEEAAPEKPGRWS